MTPEEFIQKTHAVLHDNEHFEMKISLYGKAEQEFFKEYAREYKPQIMEVLYQKQWLENRENALYCAVKHVHDVEKEWEEYNFSFQEFLNSDNSNTEKPKEPLQTVKEVISRLSKREQAYLFADRYAQSSNFEKARIGDEAKQEIVKSDSTLAETYADIIRSMKEKWLRYCESRKL